ncbi:MAG: alpha/beta hydrolase [Chloroflexi bacterium]|nr:MAG: alpha/beta hydrolase [Chloroflexota bacterium]
MSAIVIDGGLVHYEAFGRGRPVLFLHGWLGSWRYWMHTMEDVAAVRHRAYALDLWGFGDSDKTRPRYQIADYVSLVSQFVENMGIQQAPIIGHALGATVALEFAIQYPNRVSKIMAVSLPMSPDCINRKLVDLVNNTMMAKVMWWRQLGYKEVQSEAEKTAKEAVPVSIESASEIDVPGRLRALTRSTSTLLLAVYGEKDDIIDPTPLRSLDSDQQNIRSIGLTNSKHFPMLDEDAKFNRLLKDFLDIEGDLSALELKEEWRRRTR